MPTDNLREQLETRMAALPARLDPQALISQAIGTGAGIDTLERLVALAKEVREVQATEAWYEAMAEFQRTCPRIVKSSTVKTARYSYRFAPLDEICSTIQPVMGPLGLSMRWTTPRIESDKVTVACLISHRLGHVESSGDLVMPIMGATQRTDGSGEGGANAAQRVGISLTYAKRYALLGIIGLAPEDDDDATDPGDAAGATTTTGGHTLDLVINENQIRRLSAIATGAKWTDEQLHDLLSGFQYNSRKEIRLADYEAIVTRLKAGPKNGRTA